jgi:hypothetical protein
MDERLFDKRNIARRAIESGRRGRDFPRGARQSLRRNRARANFWHEPLRERQKFAAVLH